MLQVLISTTPARIGLDIQPTRLNLESRRAQAEISSTPAQVSFRQPQGTLTVDNYPSRAALGIRSAADMTAGFAQLGQEAAQELTAQYVADGNRLADISNAANTVPQLADERSTAPQYSITWAYVPPPEISYQMNPAEISWSPARIDYRVQPGSLQINVSAGSVDFRIEQYAGIEIRTAERGNFIDLKS